MNGRKNIKSHLRRGWTGRWRACGHLFGQSTWSPPRVQGGSSELLAELTKAGFKGKKSGAGIYTYSIDDGKKSKKVPNAKAQEILARYKLSPSEGASSVEDQQIRVVSRFVNEALICLEEGIISSPVGNSDFSIKLK
ncbi:hypothetical protein niasHT_037227 [Heterodera trifolii]|uniref:3-hydroxyacyl-CoA dehydrogenase C-terminal domain-containing protein n=1 Tax=Heterodera trifolii TaxID=157864 RepID=A0ABD2I697_9BILA